MNRSKLLRFTALFFAFILCFTLLSRAADQASIAVVSVKKPENMMISHRVSATGKIVQNQELAVTTESDQRVTSIAVSEGQRVEAGDLLFEIDLDLLEEKILNQKQEMRKQELTVKDAKSQKDVSEQQKSNEQAQASESYSLSVNRASVQLARAKQELAAAKEALAKFRKNGQGAGEGDSSVEEALEQAYEEKSQDYIEAEQKLVTLQWQIENDVNNALRKAKSGATLTAEDTVLRQASEDAAEILEEEWPLPEGAGALASRGEISGLSESGGGQSTGNEDLIVGIEEVTGTAGGGTEVVSFGMAEEGAVVSTSGTADGNFGESFSAMADEGIGISTSGTADGNFGVSSSDMIEDGVGISPSDATEGSAGMPSSGAADGDFGAPSSDMTGDGTGISISDLPDDSAGVSPSVSAADGAGTQGSNGVDLELDASTGMPSSGAADGGFGAPSSDTAGDGTGISISDLPDDSAGVSTSVSAADGAGAQGSNGVDLELDAIIQDSGVSGQENDGLTQDPGAAADGGTSITGSDTSISGGGTSISGGDTSISGADAAASSSASPVTQAELDQIEQSVRDSYSQELKAAQEAVAAAKAAQEEAEAALTQYQQERLAASGSADAQTEQQLINNVKTAQNNYEDAAIAANEAAVTGGRSIASAAIPNASNSSDEMYQLTYDQMELQLKKLEALKEAEGKIYAPAAGLVTKINITTGEKTTDTTAILMADLSKGYRFTAEITKEQEKYIGTGDLVTLTGSNKKELEDQEVESVSADETNEEIYHVTVQVPDDAFDIGMTVSLEFVKKSQTYTTCVPLSALHLDDKNQTYVLVPEEYDSIMGTEIKARKTSVTVLEKNESYAALADGAISGKDSVITSSDKTVDDGSRVRISSE